MLKTKHKTVTFLAVVLACLLALSCGGSFASRTGSPIQTKLGLSGRDFNFYDKSKFDVSVLGHWSDGGNRYLVYFSRKAKEGGGEAGRFFAYSDNAGHSFKRIEEFSTLLRGLDTNSTLVVRFNGNRIAIAASLKKEIYFYVSKEGIDGFTASVRVNDVPTNSLRVWDIASTDENQYCVFWQDNRDGQMKVYTSVSENGGKTWSLSSPVERHAFSGRQQFAYAVVGKAGRIHMIWMDWSDKKTLVDIRYARSDDGGKSWSESVKLNDDQLPVWQVNPTLVSVEETVIAAFADFREKGADDDGDWNVYFARSEDNGESWEKNKRLNHDAAGRQEYPTCVAGQNKGIYCIFLSTRETVFGQIMVTASADAGKTWSPEMALTESHNSHVAELSRVAALGGGRLAVQFDLLGNNRKSSHLIEAAPGFEPAKSAASVRPIERLSVTPGNVLFSDDFSGTLAGQWEEKSGLWEINDGVYDGVGDTRGSNKFSAPFYSFARFRPPASFILSGRFKLDKVAHTSAVIYFNLQNESHFAITNQFRRGAWLGTDNYPPGTSSNILNSIYWTQQPLAEKFYPFNKDKWYLFRIVVTPEQIDYYVDDSLFFSARPKRSLPPGKVGIGGHGVSPVAFDDFTVSGIDR